MQGFGLKKLKESDNLENLDIDVDGIEMDLRGIGNNMGWIHLTRSRDQWRALGNM
jgi:hypothetical protein